MACVQQSEGKREEYKKKKKNLITEQPGVARQDQRCVEVVTTTRGRADTTVW